MENRFETFTNGVAEVLVENFPIGTEYAKCIAATALIHGAVTREAVINLNNRIISETGKEINIQGVFTWLKRQERYLMAYEMGLGHQHLTDADIQSPDGFSIQVDQEWEQISDHWSKPSIRMIEEYYRDGLGERDFKPSKFRQYNLYTADENINKPE